MPDVLPEFFVEEVAKKKYSFQNLNEIDFHKKVNEEKKEQLKQHNEL